ncbi:MAG: endolytic transglycosylase MltG [bacterium]|nr:endolytic transglycosylase MltG [bacterium]
MKRLIEETLFITLGIIFLAIAIVVGGSWWWYSSNTKPVSADTTLQEIIVPPGASFAEVAENLESQKIIRNAFAFRVWTKIAGDAVTVQAGKHKFSPAMKHEEIIAELSLGIQDVRIRFNEGWRVEEMDQNLKVNLGEQYDSNKFLELARPRQGTLFPDTYEFHKTATADEVINTLHDEFEERYKKLNGPTDIEGKKRVIIIASLLEREGVNAEDRPIIAGIIENRLKTTGETVGLLQLDATLQYAIGYDKNRSTWWRTPQSQDKEITSPYNTYMYKGLPPTPICNPSEGSLAAAIIPQKNNYFYYIHDNSGKAYYARTFEEHDRNIANYL